MVNHRADPFAWRISEQNRSIRRVVSPPIGNESHREEKATAACMGPANTASPRAIQYDPETTTVRARIEAHRTSVIVFTPCDSTSRYLGCETLWPLNILKRNNGSYT